MKSVLGGKELMIDATVFSVVEKRVTQNLEDRQGVFGHEISRVKEKMNAKNAFYSGATVRLIREAIANEFRIRVSLIWAAFARALDAKGIRLDEETSSEVKRRIGDMLDAGSVDLPKHYETLAGIARGPVGGKPFQELRAAALERIWNEIDYATLKQSATSQPNTRPVNIYQSCGIVQIGEGSSASLTVNVGSEEINEIKKALESVKQAIDQSTSVASEERSQILELVSDVENEIHRDKPNKLRIRGALQGIAMTIQTIAAAPEAYQLLKGAASLLGLQLP